MVNITIGNWGYNATYTWGTPQLWGFPRMMDPQNYFDDWDIIKLYKNDEFIVGLYRYKLLGYMNHIPFNGTRRGSTNLGLS